jgi:hypothetical protein
LESLIQRGWGHLECETCRPEPENQTRIESHCFEPHRFLHLSRSNSYFQTKYRILNFQTKSRILNLNSEYRIVNSKSEQIWFRLFSNWFLLFYILFEILPYSKFGLNRIWPTTNSPVYSLIVPSGLSITQLQCGCALSHWCCGSYISSLLPCRWLWRRGGTKQLAYSRRSAWCCLLGARSSLIILYLPPHFLFYFLYA